MLHLSCRHNGRGGGRSERRERGDAEVAQLAEAELEAKEVTLVTAGPQVGQSHMQKQVLRLKMGHYQAQDDVELTVNKNTVDRL